MLTDGLCICIDMLEHIKTHDRGSVPSPAGGRGVAEGKIKKTILPKRTACHNAE